MQNKKWSLNSPVYLSDEVLLHFQYLRLNLMIFPENLFRLKLLIETFRCRSEAGIRREIETGMSRVLEKNNTNRRLPSVGCHMKTDVFAFLKSSKNWNLPTQFFREVKIISFSEISSWLFSFIKIRNTSNRSCSIGIPLTRKKSNFFFQMNGSF